MQKPTCILRATDRRILVMVVAGVALVSSGARADGPNTELQSEPLTPGVVLVESRRSVHQIRLLVEVDDKTGGGRATFVLDPNVPEFDEFGELAGGIQTPYVRGKGGPLAVVELGCDIEFIKAGPDDWLLFRLKGKGIISSLLLATRHRMSEGGPARLLVLGDDKKVKTVIGLRNYALVVP